MKILFLNSEYPPIGGGASRANKELFKAFSKYPNVKFDCITSSINNEFSKTKPYDNLTLYRIPIGEKEHTLHYQSNKDLLKYLFHSKKLANSLLKSNKYDCIHAFFTVPAGYVAYKISGKIPYVISVRGSDVPGYNSKYNLIYKFGNFIFKQIWNKAASVTANSNQLAELARQTSPELDVQIIPNGIDTSKFTFCSEEPNIVNGNYKILCVSRLTQRKRIDMIIQSIIDLQEILPNITLEIIGTGVKDKELKTLAEVSGISKQIKFTGIVDHKELPKKYHSAHIFILPSKNEGMSNTILEAIASGLPIIITDTGDAQILAKNNGIVIPINDQHALTESIKKLCLDSELRKNLRKNSQQKAQQFTWDKTADQYYKLYQSIIKQ